MNLRRGVVWCALLCSAACGEAPLSDNEVLSHAAAEDQAYRRGETVRSTDEQRVDLVLSELGSGRVRTPTDRFHAALVLQHSPLTFRADRLEAVSPHDFLLAHYLAAQALADGNESARLLVAQTLDRYLSLTKGYQKYGTNRFINQSTGVEELAPIDRNTTDEERARLGVPPLAELLARFPEQQRDTAASDTIG